MRAAGKPAPPRPRRPDDEHLAHDALAVAGRQDLTPDAPRRRTGARDAGEHHRLVHGRLDRDLGIAGRGGARELLDEIRSGAWRLAVERRRARVAVAEAVDRLERHGPVGRGFPAPHLEAVLERLDVGAAGRGEAGGARADADMALRLGLEAEVRIEGRGAMDVRARQPELVCDPRHVLGRDPALLFLRRRRSRSSTLVPARP